MVFLCTYRKEQVEIEHSVRRKYPQLWNQVIGDRRNELYHNDVLNEAISDNGILYKFDGTFFNRIIKILFAVEVIPPYTGHNESYFLSKDMYNAMIKVCRCGRKKDNGHLLRCLQKEQKIPEDGQKHSSEYVSKVPKTSFGNKIGFFLQMRSTTYRFWPFLKILIK